MSTQLAIDESASLVTWAAQTLAQALGLEADPVKTSQVGRELLAGRGEVTQGQLLEALIAAGAAVKLELRAVPLDQRSLGSAPLPLVTCA